MRRILFGLVRYLGHSAQARRQYPCHPGHRRHAEGERLVQPVHGAWRHHLRPVGRLRPSLPPRYDELRLRRPDQRGRMAGREILYLPRMPEPAPGARRDPACRAGPPAGDGASRLRAERDRPCFREPAEGGHQGHIPAQHRTIRHQPRPGRLQHHLAARPGGQAGSRERARPGLGLRRREAGGDDGYAAAPLQRRPAGADAADQSRDPAVHDRARQFRRRDPRPQGTARPGGVPHQGQHGRRAHRLGNPRHRLWRRRRLATPALAGQTA